VEYDVWVTGQDRVIRWSLRQRLLTDAAGTARRGAASRRRRQR